MAVSGSAGLSWHVLYVFTVCCFIYSATEPANSGHYIRTHQFVFCIERLLFFGGYFVQSVSIWCVLFVGRLECSLSASLYVVTVSCFSYVVCLFIINSQTIFIHSFIHACNVTIIATQFSGD